MWAQLTRPPRPIKELLATKDLARDSRFKFTTGDCFFDALSFLIDQSQPRHFSRSLRIMFASWLNSSLISAGDPTDMAFDILNRISSDDDAPSSLSAYLDALSTPAASGGLWGDNSVASIACMALGVNISIFVHDASGDTLIHNNYTKWPADCGRFYLLFIGKTDGGHYEPLFGPDPMPSVADIVRIHKLVSQARQLKPDDLLWRSEERLNVLHEHISNYMAIGMAFQTTDEIQGATARLMGFISADKTKSSLSHRRKKRKD